MHIYSSLEPQFNRSATGRTKSFLIRCLSLISRTFMHADPCWAQACSWKSCPGKQKKMIGVLCEGLASFPPNVCVCEIYKWVPFPSPLSDVREKVPSKNLVSFFSGLFPFQFCLHSIHLFICCSEQGCLDV